MEDLDTTLGKLKTNAKSLQNSLQNLAMGDGIVLGLPQSAQEIIHSIPRMFTNVKETGNDFILTQDTGIFALPDVEKEVSLSEDLLKSLLVRDTDNNNSEPMAVLKSLSEEVLSDKRSKKKLEEISKQEDEEKAEQQTKEDQQDLNKSRGNYAIVSSNPPKLPTKLKNEWNDIQASEPGMHSSKSAELISSLAEEEHGASGLNRFQRALKTLSKRHERTVDHINSFIRVNALLKKNIVYKITIAKTVTVEFLARQIEAEYAFDHPSEPILECGMIYDEDNTALQFDDLIGDVLDMNSTIKVMNIHEEEPMIITSRGMKSYSHVDEIEIRSLKEEENGDAVAVSDQLNTESPKDREKAVPPLEKSKSGVNITSEERFQAILNNKISLQFFKDYCIENGCIELLLFWMEVETLQTIEPAQRLLLCKYIYLTFIADSAPLKVNLAFEIRKDILFPVSPNLSMFDDAQENIYALLKREAFLKFEQNEKFLELQKQKLKDLDSYLKQSITNFAETFAPKYETMLFVVAQDPNPYIDPSVRTPEMMDTYLVNAITRYFTLHQPIHNYYDSSRRMSRKQRSLQVTKERRLAKFFGQQVSHDLLSKQIQYLHMDGDIEEQEEDTVEESKHQQSKDDEAPEKRTKKKKADKLNEFFGNILPSGQLVNQNLVGTSNSTHISSDQEGELGPMPIMNVLHKEQKMALSKRNRKLMGILGENLGESTIHSILVAPTLKNISYEDDDDGDEDDEEQDKPHVNRKKLVFSKSDASIEYDEHAEGQSSTPGQQIGKLQRFLGERINRNLLQNIQRAAKVTGPLDPKEKKFQKKRAGKLEKMFGKVPPSEIILRNFLTDEKKALMSLDMVLDDQEEVVELLSYMEQEEPEQEEEEDEEVQKNLRQKRFNKLTKFFGQNDIDISDLMEQKILKALQESIERKYNGDDLENLKKELENVRAKVKQASFVIGSRLSSTKQQPEVDLAEQIQENREQ